MLGLFSLLFGLQLDSFIGAGFGFLYGCGYLNYFLLPSTSLLSYEADPRFEILTSLTGFVSHSAAAGPTLPFAIPSFPSSTTTQRQSKFVAAARSLLPTFEGAGRRLGSATRTEETARPPGTYVQLPTNDPSQ
eukprot:c6099_g1_i2.p1 GENE.c6099_g1_i2~~c6099_g1_i2.p1  ORF type:complete len:133 (+),score=25.26 c6099_g1_i2:87-485(+)